MKYPMLIKSNYIYMDDEIGTVAEGYCADLLLVEGNPAEDIDALDRVQEVHRNGELVYSTK